MKKRDLSLIQKNVLFIIIPTIIVLVLAEVFFISEYRQDQIEDEEDTIYEKMNTSTEFIEGYIQRISEIPQIIANNPAVKAANETTFIPWFETILSNTPDIINVYTAYETLGNLTWIYRDQGNITSETRPPADYVNADQIWFDLPMTTGEFVITDAYFDFDFMQDWIISFLEPIYNQSNHLIGIVGVDITLDQLNQVCQNLTTDDTFFAFMLENNHKILAIQNTSYLGQPIEQYALDYRFPSIIDSLNHFESINEIQKSSYKHEDHNHFVYKKHIEITELNWDLYVSVAQFSLYEQANRTMFWMAIFGIFLVLGLSYLILRVSSNIIQPIQALAESSQIIAEGNTNHTINIKASGEVQELIENFKQMVKNIHNQLQLFRFLADFSPFPIMIYQQSGNIEYINPAFKRTFGYSKTDIPTGKEWFQKAYPDPEYREKVFAEWKNDLEKGEDITSHPKIYQVATKDGSILKIAFRLINFEEKRYYLVLENITERQHQEEEKLRQQKIESISLLAGGIAHDFNNILMSILGNVNILQLEENLPNNIQISLKQIEKSILQANGLTKQLLTFSKGGNPVKKTQSIIPIILDSIEFAMHGSKCKCIFDPLTDEISDADIDSGQISQVLNNILLNAQQAMPKGGIIKVQLKELKLEKNNPYDLHSGQYLQISIVDQGKGIHPKNFDKIFSPYFSTKSEGNGLGLATSYSIITKHNGTIFFESELDKGTTFHIIIPASDKSGENIKTTLKLEEKKYSGTVLIMDDDQNITNILQEMLERLNFSVKVAYNGEQALRIYQDVMDTEAQIRFVILDLTIPGGMGGKETMKKLKKISPDLKTIVSSGYSNDPVLSNYKKEGFNGRLNKPFTFIELKHTINEILD